MLEKARVQENALFAVDSKFLKSADDLKADDNGVWLLTGKPWKWYIAEQHFEDNDLVFVKVVSSTHVPLKRHEKVYQLSQLYEQNQSTPEFQRIFCFFRDGNGNTLDVVLLQYYFEGGKKYLLLLYHLVTINPVGLSFEHRGVHWIRFKMLVKN